MLSVLVLGAMCGSLALPPARHVSRPPVWAARTQDVDALVDRAVAAYAKVRTLRASFEQTLTNPLTGSVAVAHGEFQQRRPALLAVLFSDPAGDRIVADGRFLWIYLPSTTPDQVVKIPAGVNSTGPFDLTAQFLDAPRTRYSIRDAGRAKIGGRAVHAVNLVPKTDEPFVKATVWIDETDATVRQFEVVDGSGLTRRIRFISLAINGPVDREAFVFTPASGTKVIDQSVLFARD
ncbi:MAG: hypothetical protein NVS4B3_26280 [Gemmatimonadaceae bacterium]